MPDRIYRRGDVYVMIYATTPVLSDNITKQKHL